MQNRRTLIPIFTILFTISLLIITLSLTGVLSHFSLINTLFAPLQKMLVVKVHGLSSQSPTNQKLLDENNNLRKQLVDYKDVQKENNALRDQFQTTNPPSTRLLPANIVGEPGFIPNTTSVESMILDKGSANGIKQGAIVVYKDNLVGRVSKISTNFSQVEVVSNTSITFTAKTQRTNALGIIKGQGQGDILFDNIVTDQKISSGDIVVTSGNVAINGQGYPPNLIVGKITSVEKDPSALFQQASVQSFVDILKLDMVFVMVNK